MQTLIQREMGVIRLPIVVSAVSFGDDTASSEGDEPDWMRERRETTYARLQAIADAESFADTPPAYFEIETDPGKITFFTATVPNGSQVNFFRINTKACASYDKSFIAIDAADKVLVERAEFGSGELPADTKMLETDATTFVVKMSAPYARRTGCCTSHGVAVFEAWGRTREMQQDKDVEQPSAHAPKPT